MLALAGTSASQANSAVNGCASVAKIVRVARRPDIFQQEGSYKP